MKNIKLKAIQDSINIQENTTVPTEITFTLQDVAESVEDDYVYGPKTGYQTKYSYNRDD